jgi:ketosteroid isomerase-like protein
VPPAANLPLIQQSLKVDAIRDIAHRKMKAKASFKSRSKERVEMHHGFERLRLRGFPAPVMSSISPPSPYDRTHCKPVFFKEVTMSNAQIQTDALRAYLPPTDPQLAAASDLVARFAARWNKPDADSLRDLMHPDTRNLIPPMAEPGDREAVVEHFRGVLSRLPDLRVEVIRWAPTGDAVLVESRATATVGGQPLSWTGVDRFNIRGDRMYEAEVYWTRAV